MNHSPTACLIIIGNEILSGRTQDVNLVYLAQKLETHGVRLMRAHIVPDDEHTIVSTLNEARAAYEYVFTTGGIGPTHDDITTICVARAFGVEILRDAEAQRRLEAHYSADKLNAARLKMADIPCGATLIDNPVSSAPGYRLENVFVMAGVPVIMQAMCDHAMTLIDGGVPMLSRSVSAFAREGDIAAGLAEIQARYPDVAIGCYPLMRDGKAGCSLVARGYDEDEVEKVIVACEALLRIHTL